MFETVFVGLFLIGLVQSQRFFPPQQQGSIAAPISPLASEAYSEGACVQPGVSNTVDPDWLVKQRVFYVPIASQFANRRRAETLLSRYAVTDFELASMCTTMEFNPSGSGWNLTTVGYDNREFRRSCIAVGVGTSTCDAEGSSPGVNPAKMRKVDDYVVATDNRSYLLLVRCIDGFFRDYELLTTRPTLSQEVLNVVLNATRNLGFDERRLQALPYDDCFRSSTDPDRNRRINGSLQDVVNGRGGNGRDPLSRIFGASPFLAPFARPIQESLAIGRNFVGALPAVNPVNNGPPPGPRGPFGDPFGGFGGPEFFKK